jgi:hypothetical protein
MVLTCASKIDFMILYAGGVDDIILYFFIIVLVYINAAERSAGFRTVGLVENGIVPQRQGRRRHALEADRGFPVLFGAIYAVGPEHGRKMIGSGRGRLIIIQEIACRIQGTDLCVGQFLHIRFIRIHDIQGIVIIGVGEINFSVVFTEKSSIV